MSQHSYNHGGIADNNGEVRTRDHSRLTGFHSVVAALEQAVSGVSRSRSGILPVTTAYGRDRNGGFTAWTFQGADC